MPCHFFRLSSYPFVKLTESSSDGLLTLCLKPRAVNFNPRSNHSSPSEAFRSLTLG